MAKSAAKISIAIEAQTASLQKGFAEAKNAITTLDKGMSTSVAKGMAMFTAGMIAVRVIVKAVTEAYEQLSVAMDRMDRERESAMKIGLAADQLAALEHAATKCGLEIGAMEISLIKMNKATSEAATSGTGVAAQALQELGLNAERVNKLPTDQKLGAIADALSKVANLNDRTRLSMELFGRAGHGFLLLIDQGAAGLDKFSDEYTALGANLGNQRDIIDRAKDSIVDMKKAWGALVDQVAIFVAPALTIVANLMTEIAIAFNRLRGLSATTGSPDSFGGGMKEAKQRADDITVESTKAAEKAAEAIESAKEQLKAKGTSIAESLRTPSEIYRDTIAELNDLVNAGLLNWELYQRGIRRAVDELSKGKQVLQDWNTPAIEAVTRGSSGAFSAVQANQRTREDADRRHQEQVTWLARIEAAVLSSTIELQPVKL